MEHDRQVPPGRVPLPRFDDATETRKAAAARDSGWRRLRHMSNWTAAALLAGVAATSGYFLHATPVTAATTVIAGQPLGGTASAVGGSHRPTLVSPVATSSGSGVTVGASSGGAAGGAGGAVGVNGVSTVSTWKDN